MSVIPCLAAWETTPCLGSWPAVAARLPSHLRSARGRSGGTSLIPSELDWPSGPIVPYAVRLLGASIFAAQGGDSPAGTHQSSLYEKKKIAALS